MYTSYKHIQQLLFQAHQWQTTFTWWWASVPCFMQGKLSVCPSRPAYACACVHAYARAGRCAHAHASPLLPRGTSAVRCRGCGRGYPRSCGGRRRAAEAAARTAAADSLLPAVLLSPQLRSQTRRCCCGRRRAAGAWPPSYALAKFRPSTGATEDRQNKNTSDRKQSSPDASRDRARGASGGTPPAKLKPLEKLEGFRAPKAKYIGHDPGSQE